MNQGLQGFHLAASQQGTALLPSKGPEGPSAPAQVPGHCHGRNLHLAPAFSKGPGREHRLPEPQGNAGAQGLLTTS